MKTENTKRLYIAYGSNLDTKQMKFRCPTAKPIAKSWLFDYQLVFQGYPHGAHANVIPKQGYAVPVAVWEITAADERSLDRYEGVAGGYYTKEYLTIEVNGEMREALIYIMTPHDFGVPADVYLATIVRGYRDFNLDAGILNAAVRYSTAKTPVRYAPMR